MDCCSGSGTGRTIGSRIERSILRSTYTMVCFASISFPQCLSEASAEPADEDTTEGTSGDSNSRKILVSVESDPAQKEEVLALKLSQLIVA